MLKPEVIGPQDCPLMLRWTFVKWRGWKLMVHRFTPAADDKDVHDHPAKFLTFVLRGEYRDLVPCSVCRGTRDIGADPDDPWCPFCSTTGVMRGERMKAGMLRVRPAEYAHRTKVGPRGCLTVVLMWPKSRRWGFWRSGRWWYWKDYEEEFGFAMRCEDLPKEYRK